MSSLAQALAARDGLWGNHGYRAVYPMAYADADQHDGHNRYTLTFAQDPPVYVFWSITMYDLPGFYLVAEPDRPLLHQRRKGRRPPAQRCHMGADCSPGPLWAAHDLRWPLGSR